MSEKIYKQRWRDLGFKEKASYTTALASFFLGWTIIFIGLLMPPAGRIDPTVITAFGTALIYCGGIFGVSLYIKSNTNEFYSNIMKEFSESLEKHYKKHHNEDDK